MMFTQSAVQNLCSKQKKRGGGDGGCGSGGGASKRARCDHMPLDTGSSGMTVDSADMDAGGCGGSGADGGGCAPLPPCAAPAAGNVCCDDAAPKCAIGDKDIDKMIAGVPTVTGIAQMYNTAGAKFDPTKVDTYTPNHFVAQSQITIFQAADFICDKDGVPFTGCSPNPKLCMSEDDAYRDQKQKLTQAVFGLVPYSTLFVNMTAPANAACVRYPLAGAYDQPGASTPTTGVAATEIRVTIPAVALRGTSLYSAACINKCDVKSVVCKADIVFADAEFGYALIRLTDVITGTQCCDQTDKDAVFANVFRYRSSPCDVKIGDRVFVITSDGAYPTWVNNDAWTDRCGYFHEVGYAISYDSVNANHTLGAPVVNAALELVGILLCPLWAKSLPLEIVPPQLSSKESLVLPVKEIQYYLNFVFSKMLGEDSDRTARYLRTVDDAVTYYAPRRGFLGLGVEQADPGFLSATWLAQTDGQAPPSGPQPRLDAALQLVDNPIATDNLRGQTVVCKLGAMDTTDGLSTTFAAPTKATNPAFFYPCVVSNAKSDVPKYVGSVQMNRGDLLLRDILNKQLQIGRFSDACALPWTTLGAIMRSLAANPDAGVNAQILVQPNVSPATDAAGRSGAFPQGLPSATAPRTVTWRVPFVDRPLSLYPLFMDIPNLADWYVNYLTVLVNPV